MIEIAALVTSAWTVIQPLLPVIALKGAEEIGKRAVGEVWDLVKKKFDEKPETQKVVEKLLKEPQNAVTQGAFQYHLQDMLESDPTFATSLAKLLETAGSDFKGQVIGGGALAQGDHAKAVGQGGILIEGGVTGNTTAGNSQAGKQ
ncbi:MAG: hypothetical protein EHM81_09020 [Chloroflexi bacterium]|nr:MAG: hypothetical protein EHM81_09020 [Chloroflexota bacterium]